MRHLESRSSSNRLGHNLDIDMLASFKIRDSGMIAETADGSCIITFNSGMVLKSSLGCHSKDTKQKHKLELTCTLAKKQRALGVVAWSC